MTLETTSLIATLFFLAQVSVNGFSFQSIQTVKCTQSLYSQRNTKTSLHMGLFDGVKEAFQAPTLERSFLDAQRETPIDRWMGWNAKSTEEKKPSAISTGTLRLYCSVCDHHTLFLPVPSYSYILGCLFHTFFLQNSYRHIH